MSDIITVSDGDQWVIKVTNEGELQFNTEKYPKLTPDEFAQKFIDTLRKQKIYGDYDFSQVIQTIQALEKQNDLLEDANFGLKQKVNGLTHQIKEMSKK